MRGTICGQPCASLQLAVPQTWELAGHPGGVERQVREHEDHAACGCEQTRAANVSCGVCQVGAKQQQKKRGARRLKQCDETERAQRDRYRVWCHGFGLGAAALADTVNVSVPEATWPSSLSAR